MKKIYARLIKIAKRLRKRTNTTGDNDFEIESEDETYKKNREVIKLTSLFFCF